MKYFGRELKIKGILTLFHGRIDSLPLTRRLHTLLLNLGVDTMLRASDLLKLKTKDVMHECKKPKTEVKIKQKKTGKHSLLIRSKSNNILVIPFEFLENPCEPFRLSLIPI